MNFQFGSGGTGLRLGRLLGNDGAPVVIVAMDHGLAGVPAGFSRPGETIGEVVAAEPDGVLLSAGMARRFAPLLAHRRAPSLVVAIDQVIHQGFHGSGPVVAHGPGASVEDAVTLGADAVKTMLMLGGEDEADQLRNTRYLAETAEACRHWEIPLMVEPYLWGVNAPDDPVERAKLAADGARIAVELGADLVKVEYGRDADAFRELVDSCLAPVLVLGGPKRGTSRDIVEEVIAAADAGAAGITMGRNIWGRPSPARMICALAVALATRDPAAAMAELGGEEEDTSP